MIFKSLLKSTKKIQTRILNLGLVTVIGFSGLMVSAPVLFSAPAYASTGNVLEVGAGQTYTTIQSAVNAANPGDTINVASGTYTEDVNITKSVTLNGLAGAKLVVVDGSSSNGMSINANNVTIQGFDIEGPVSSSYTTYTWSSNISRGIVVASGVTGFTITNNKVENLRNDILIDGRGNTGSVTNNVIDNSKSGISVQYTDGTGITIADNSQGVYGNDWGMNLHLNGYYDGTTVHSNPYPGGAATSSAQSVIKTDSSLNGGWTVQDQAYTSSNRTAVTVATNGTASAQGDPLGPIDTMQNGINAIVPGGTINVSSGTYNLSSELDITKPMSIVGQGTVTLESANALWNTTNTGKHIIGIYSGTSSSPVTISNVTIDSNSQSYGVNTYANAYGNLNNVTIKNSKGAALTVNGSTIIATNLNTSDNAWGSVNVDPGSGVVTPSVFTFNSGNLTENNQIWSDGANDTSTATVTVNAVGFNMYKVSGTNTGFTWSNAPLTSSTPQFTVTSPTQPVDLTVSSGTNDATVDFSSLGISNNNTVVVPQTTVNTAGGDISIPASTTITASGSWNGVINVPTIEANSSVSIGSNKTVSSVIEVGSNSVSLTFSNAVRLLIPGQSGKSVGFVRNGVFTQISTPCQSDAQAAGNALPAGGDCYFDNGTDMVVWTKHFTTFVTYVQAATQPVIQKTYTVLAGDTLSGIGTLVGVDWHSIASLNGISAPYTIYPGQVLDLPANASTAVTASPVITQSTSASAVLGESTTKTPPVAKATKNPVVASVATASLNKNWFKSNWLTIVLVIVLAGAIYYAYRSIDKKTKKS